MNPSQWSIGVGAVPVCLVAALSWAQDAEALRCARRGLNARVLYPGNGRTVPRNITIYINVSGVQPKDLFLVQRSTSKRVAVVVLRNLYSAVVRMQLAKPLPGGQVFDVRLRKSVLQRMRIRASTGNLLGWFRTNQAIARPQIPVIGRPRVKFSPPRTGRWVGSGRSADIVLPRASRSPPVVVEVYRFRP